MGFAGVTGSEKVIIFGNGYKWAKEVKTTIGTRIVETAEGIFARTRANMYLLSALGVLCGEILEFPAEVAVRKFGKSKKFTAEVAENAESSCARVRAQLPLLCVFLSVLCALCGERSLRIQPPTICTIPS
jgi:hypothetical protein